MVIENGITGLPGFVEVALVAATGFLGWRIGAAKDAVRIHHQEKQIEELKCALTTLRRDLHGTDRESTSSWAAVNASLTSTADVLKRLDERISRLEDSDRGK